MFDFLFKCLVEQRRHFDRLCFLARTWRFIFNEPLADSSRLSAEKWRRLREEGDFVLEVKGGLVLIKGFKL